MCESQCDSQDSEDLFVVSDDFVEYEYSRKRVKPTRRAIIVDTDDEMSNDSNDADSTQADEHKSEESEASFTDSEDEKSDSDASDSQHQDDFDDEYYTRKKKAILKRALMQSGVQVKGDLVYRKNLGKYAGDKRNTGSYHAILLPFLEKILEETANTEDNEKEPWFPTLKPIGRHMVLDSTDAIGCLCTQTPIRGKIEYVFEMEHKSTVKFLVGECCLMNAINLDRDWKNDTCRLGFKFHGGEILKEL